MPQDILKTAKGMRDFTPSEMLRREKVLKILEQVFQNYGFNPLDTPIVENYALFMAKFAVGTDSDVMKETFRLTDQGGRDLVLRSELTVPFARYIGMNPTMKLPFRRYQIGKVFRDGPIKAGRYREFYQCDADMVGSSDMLADAECVLLGIDFFKRLNLDIKIKINNRKILNALVDKAGIPVKHAENVLVALDKFNKIGADGIASELKEKGVDAIKIGKLLELVEFADKGKNNTERFNNLMATLGECQGLVEMRELLSYLPADAIEFNPTLVRGQAYYTGTIYEFFATDSKVTSSIAGGGRFDDMIGKFLNSPTVYPAVGISFGMETIMDVLEEQKWFDKLENIKVVSQIYVVALEKSLNAKALEVAEILRERNLAVEVEVAGRKLKKCLEYANSLNIPSVIILGADEIAAGSVMLRSMTSGEQKMMRIEELGGYKF